MAPVHDDVITGSVSVELVHLGSLYHDDVMDEATTRRTVESVNAKWGNLQAILAGDFLLARASELAASLGTEVAGLLAATIGRLCEGQILELQHTYDARPRRGDLPQVDRGQDRLAVRHGVPDRRHRERASPATTSTPSPSSASPTAWPSRSSTTSSTSPPPTSSSASRPATTSSRASTPCRSSAPWPSTGSDRDRLRALLGQPLELDQMDEARSIVRSNGAIGASLDVARTYVDQATAALAPLGPSEAATGLAGAAEHLLAGLQDIAAA